MMAIKRSNYCFHRSGGKDPCHINSNPYMIAFGIMQIVLSQIPNFDQLWRLSIVAAAITTRKVVYHNITITKCSKYSTYSFPQRVIWSIELLKFEIILDIADSIGKF
ncbi:putative amino acid transporter, transmembrane domain-containing protein [Rosa chinensis]|uniref:Putative amino acid transporter, transmembrane domain-containing protein n=2 Tax=Rosa chinensis TaxID=74649 RepID=A0A2P6QBY2_ROSCH|nr:putative amino acid transporter, transmembrane domain-containing protein [Rosa chinensis]